MLGELNENQIEDLLKQQATGRLGCHAHGITYVVPINYVYRDGCIYGHSAIGKKIQMLRNNPEVCFQVDIIESLVKWQSVIAWGTYQEITNRKELQKAMHEIISHIMPLMSDTEGHPSHGITESESDVGGSVDLILYKIPLNKKTGRFEHP
ncbi:pyridoxamine 5'-phosphate oxidase family protein [Pedobacter sp. MC2016-14]|uniref:pyridoxamine 5'-phosphate oxidase family protein n=1 Tax=Pedobacter sp. MC2016-14 TaxID=2897327 RepID=UPI001E62FB27|nr:pyridoxamine 5'-phosphate oxidase family protein [Pedobacter sp. MC2016-14]MCD0487825.1 pyridoxamine 5'-phosphate oxidase family protein [Pedobacter sp. MC2016-14]